MAGNNHLLKIIIMESNKLIKKIKIEGTIEAISGLHIGGTNAAMGIGGTDSPVIRNPIDNKPYIPGSSLKGKMRAMLEISTGTIDEVHMGQVKNGPTMNPDHLSAKLFGTASNDERQRPSRVFVRDGELLSDEAIFVNTDLPFTETKTEVVIDRITSKAMPRQLERVPAGARFRLDMVLNVFSEDDQEELINGLFQALKLVQDDYLGGSGSRGSGKVSFKIEKLSERTMEFYAAADKAETDLAGKYKSLIQSLED
jgi:CRISPR-associated protein Csm3